MRNGPYELIIPPKIYPGKLYRDRYAYEHHVVWWENTGEVVEDGYLIHHKNENKRDNNFENLCKIARNAHSSLHSVPREMFNLVCKTCGDTFEREARNVRAQKKKGQKDFYCNRSCMAKDFGCGRKKNIPL